MKTQHYQIECSDVVVDWNSLDYVPIKIFQNA